MKFWIIFFAFTALLHLTSAQQSAASCEINANNSTARQDIVIEIGIDPTTKTGEPTKLSWGLKSPVPSQDLYLVLATPSATRFSGDGFIALPAGARAPRSIKALSDKTRLIIPLAGTLANPQGSAAILFYVTGQQEISWAVVAVSETGASCTESLRSQGSASVVVVSGAPRFVAQDRFSTGSPKARIASSDGRFLLFEFSDRYQLYDAKTGDLLAERAGTTPRFSPSGRYIASRGGSDRLQIFDAVAQRLVFETDEALEGNYGGAAVGLWMNQDAVLVLGYGRQGAVGISLALIDGRQIFSALGCNGCHAFGTASFWLDLDTFSVQFDNSEDLSFSLLEVADSPNTVKAWDDSKVEDRGPAPKRPKFVAASVDRFGAVRAELRVAASEKYEQDDFLWKFSDAIKVSFYRVWNGDVKTQRAILASHADVPHVVPAREVAARAPGRGKVSERVVEVGDVRVSPRNGLERLAINLQAFKTSIFDTLPVDPIRVPAGEFDRSGKRAVSILQAAMAILSNGRPRLIFRARASKEAHRTTYFAKSYAADLPACQYDEGPEDAAQPADQADGRESEESPPVISANRLSALWTFQLRDGTLVIAQQHMNCGTAPDSLGDLVAVFSPRDTSHPITFTRFAASYSDGGAVSDPGGIDRDRVQSGAALALDVRPDLQMTVIDQRWLIVASKDSGGVIVLEVPTMRRLGLVRRVDNPLDLAAVTLTTDHQTLVQLNRSGALSFYRFDTQEPVLRGRVVDDELVLFDSSLNFEATPEGAAYVYVQVPGTPQLFTLNQFSKTLWMSSLAEKRLYQAVPASPPPTNMTPPNIEVSQSGASFEVEAHSETELARLSLAVDGAVVRTWPLRGQAINIAVPTDSIPTGRWASFSVEDISGIKSIMRSFKLSDAPYAGTLRVLAVGANEFKSTRYRGKTISDLAFAKSDARRFEASFKAYLASSYARYDGVLLNAETLSRDKLVEAIRERALATNSQDTFVLFFASHGASDAKGFNLLVPGERPGTEVSVLPFSEIANLVQLSRGRVLVFLDACHSADAKQDTASEELAAARENIVIIAASKGRQSSLEGKAWGGGVFTSAVVDALKMSRKGETLALEKLYADVRRSVVSETSGRQTPWLRRPSWQGEQSIN